MGSAEPVPTAASEVLVSTEGRRATREVERYFALAPEMVILAGFDGYWKRVNPAVEAILGYIGFEALSRPFMDFVHPEDRERTEEEGRRVIEGATARAFVNRILCRDGSYKWIEWTAIPVPEECVMWGLGRDVTERRRSEREQAALQRVATLVAGADKPRNLFAVVAEEVARVLEVPVVSVVRYETDDTATEYATFSTDGPALSTLRQWSLDGTSVLRRVRANSDVARIDDYSELGGEVAAAARQAGLRSTIGAPIVVAAQTWGAMVVSSKDEPLPESIAARLAAFTDLLATAIGSAESRAALARLAEEQAALRRVATLVARDASSDEVFECVATEVGRLFDTDITIVGRYDDDGMATAIGGWNASPGGVPVGTRAAVGGRNLLTMVAETGKPARIDGYDDATGDAAEIARRHGWRSSIAAPIVVEDHVWGVMLVATQGLEPFPAGAEERLAAFTDLISTAVANAQARNLLERVAAEQATLRRIATLVAKGAQPDEVFEAVAEEVAAMFDAITAVTRFEHDPPEVVLVGASNEIETPTGTRWDLDDGLAAAKVFRTGCPARITRAELSSGGGKIGEAAAQLGIGSTVASSIIVEGSMWGAITVNAEELPPDTEERLEKFTDLITTAIANAEGKSELAASRRRIVAASDEARRRIERDLHDGTQQRLVSLALALRNSQSGVPPDLESLRAELGRVESGLVAAVEDLQQLSRGIHPAILSEGGLGPALRTLARRSAVPVELDIASAARFPEPIEVAAYYVTSEALANAAKHAQASLIGVSLAARDGRLELCVSDDGLGGADTARGSGLIGLQDRVEALGGTLTIESPADAGTSLAVTLPLGVETTDVPDTAAN